ncbi:MAG: aspartate carbamoyltransferase catalytic subunit [Pseudomonadota bacterium]
MTIVDSGDETAAVKLRQPHLLGVADLDRATVDAVLDQAEIHADRNLLRKAPTKRTLEGKTLINLFFENSTRTQASFEMAAQRLGANVMNMAIGTSSVSKGETLMDTAGTLNAMLPDILVVRHGMSGAVALLAEKMECAVVNAGDGRHEHPTQALLDALTMRRAFRDSRGLKNPAARLEGLTIAICGDVQHSRVARSTIFLHQILGSRIRLAGPPTLAPAGLEALGVTTCASLEEAASGADVVMMLRLQSERMQGAYIASAREYYHAFGLKRPDLAGAAPDALVMHPGPMNRGVEIDSDLADDPSRSAVAQQVQMGVAVRMAVLEAVANTKRPPEEDREPAAPPRPGLFWKARGAAARAAAPEPLALLNARLIDPETGREQIGGVLIEGDTIAAVGPKVGAEPLGDQIKRVDCAGAALAPGLVDMRVFIGEPGARHKESFGSGGEAAVAGGVTTIVTQPGTSPAVDDPAILDFIQKRVLEESERHAMPHVQSMAALTKGLEGREMSEYSFLKQAGAVALSDGDRQIASAAVLRRCMQTAASLGMVVCLHPQDASLSKGACATSGIWAFRRGLPAAPAAAEAMALARDLALAELTGAAYHAAQISTAGSVALIEAAKAEGLNVTCAVSVPHFALSEEAIAGYRTFYKVDPPLRAEQDREAMVAALASGAIDCIVSSHQPQNEESKRQPYEEAAAGAVGLETLLSASLAMGAEAGLSLPEVIRLVSLNPARRLGLECGRLAVGAPADLALFDPDQRWVVDRRTLKSKSKNSPFHRAELPGVVLKTIVDGRVVYDARGQREPGDRPGDRPGDLHGDRNGAGAV